MTKGGFSLEGGLDATGMRLAVVVARFNAHVTGALYDGCRDELGAHGLDQEQLTTIEVPGCFELPIVAKKLAETKQYDAIVCLNAVIRGDTPHFDYVCRAVTDGVLQLNLTLPVPTIFGVLTVDNEQQALDRIGGTQGHKGKESAISALKMIGLHQKKGSK